MLEVRQHLEKVAGERITKWIACREVLNKFGEITKKHFHLNMYIHDKKNKVKKDTLQKWIRRKGAKGNAAYALQFVEDPKDEDRWWRYTLKEAEYDTLNPRESNVWHGDAFECEDIWNMQKFAADERKRQVEQNLKTREKLMSKNNFRNKLFKYLEEQFPDEQRKRALIKEIAKFYQKEGNSPPGNKLLDICWDYLVETGRASWDDWIDQKYGKDF